MKTIKNFINEFKDFCNEVKTSNNKIKTILPNLLTSLRAIAPFFIIPAVLSNNLNLAFIFTALFASTDAFDGLLARKFKTTSNFGKHLDPICDKIFIMGLVIPLITNKIMTLTLILEGIISMINLNSENKNNNPKSTYLGKFKTVVLSLLLINSYLFRYLNISLIKLIPFIATTNIIQLITACDYLKIDIKKDIQKEEVKENNIIKNTNSENINKIQKEIKNYKELKNYLNNSRENTYEKIDIEKRKHLNL